MACLMCEAYVNDVIHKTLLVRKVIPFHSKGQTQILCEDKLDGDALRGVISAIGYQALSIQLAPYEKKGLLSSRK